MKIIFDYNRTLFDPETNDLYLGVLELLQKLSKTYELFLISRNEPVRKMRLEAFNIKNYFQQILFVDEKSEQIFKKIGGSTKKVIVVGDSISDEIKIGNQLGFITVRIKKGKFASEVPKTKDEIAKFNITDLRDLESIILSYEK
ncbi:MAG: HAD hydrolase-like protein [Candidatus Paceibacterota bacterium]